MNEVIYWPQWNHKNPSVPSYCGHLQHTMATRVTSIYISATSVGVWTCLIIYRCTFATSSTIDLLMPGDRFQRICQCGANMFEFIRPQRGCTNETQKRLAFAMYQDTRRIPKGNFLDIVQASLMPYDLGCRTSAWAPTKHHTVR